MTDQYLADRSAMLSWVVKFNAIDGRPDDAKQVSAPWRFDDRASGRTVELTPNGASYTRFNQVIFGKDDPANGDIINGDIYTDRLYGGLGNDTLNGNAGADYLEGNAGNDTLTGGAGSDTLMGGAGTDTYIFSSGDGWDWIDDSDGSGVIQYDGVMLTGGSKVPGTANVWQQTSGGKTFTYSLYDRTENNQTFKVLSILGPGGGLWVKRWQPGQLGITLPDSLAAPAELQASADTGTTKTTAWYGQDHKVIDASGQGPLEITAVGDYGEVWGSGRLLGNASDNYLHNGEGDDELYGYGGRDVLVATGGADKLYGGDGDDALQGGEGDDLLQGDAGNDVLAGGLGSDVLDGGEGDDYLLGGSSNEAVRADWSVTHEAGHIVFNNFLGDADLGNDGADILLGGAGNDWLWGGEGDDLLDGGADNDDLIGGIGADQLLGGAGADKLFGDGAQSSSPDYYILPQYHGNDILDGGDGNDFISGDGGADELTGGAGDDTLTGDANGIPIEYQGNDILDGGDGTDKLYGYGGDDTLIGGAGDDRLEGDADTGGLAYAGHGNDTLDGGAGEDMLLGDGGDDILLGGDDDDQLHGDAGDVPIANQGDDLLDGGRGVDMLNGYGGDDTLLGGSGNDFLFGGDGNDSLTGGTGADYLDGGAGDDTYLVQSGDAPLQAAGVTETIVDSGGDDTLELRGIALADLAVSLDASGRYLVLNAGNDRIAIDGGLAGTVEHYRFDDGQVLGAAELIGRKLATPVQQSTTIPGATLIGGTQNDTLTSSGGNAMLSGGRGNDTLSALGDNNTLLYQAGDGIDTIQIHGSGNVLRLGAGIAAADMTLGLVDGALELGVGYGTLRFTGLDLQHIQAAPPFDRIEFADGSTLAYADLVARGFDIKGTNSADTLSGTSAADRIDGGRGNDTLSGGGGADIYLLRTGGGADTVIDGGAETNVLRFESWQSPASLSATRAGDDLKLAVRGTADGVTVKNYYAGAQNWTADFGGANAMTLEDAIARSDAAATAIGGLWADTQSQVIAAQIWSAENGYINYVPALGGFIGWTPLGNLSYEVPWSAQPSASITHQVTTTTYRTLTGDLISSSQSVDDSGQVLKWGYGAANPVRAVYHYDVHRIASNDALIANDYQGREEVAHGSAVATLVWENGQYNYQHSTWNTTGFVVDALGNPLSSVRYDYDLESYQRGGWVLNYHEGTVGWTAPVDTLVGNQVAVDYVQSDHYVPLVAEIVAGDGDNEIHANSGATELVDGGAGNDTIYGGGGAMGRGDLLYGNDGDDVIHGDGSVMAGGNGSDRLIGGAGADRYVVLAADESGVDIVTDTGDSQQEYQDWQDAQLKTAEAALRREHGGQWALEFDGFLFFDTLDEAATAFVEYPWLGTMEDALASGALALIEPLPPPVLGDSKDYRLVQSDVIGPHDVVELPEGVTSADLAFSWGTQTGDDGLTRATLDVAWQGATRLRVVMPGAADPIGWGVEYFKLADGSYLSMGDAVDRAPPMPDMGDGTLVGNRNANVLTAEAGGGHLFGMGGDDTLIGGAGADQLYGGDGNDTLLGGVGDDIYVFGRGDGHDRVLDAVTAPEGANKVYFRTGIAPDEVATRLDGSDLVLQIAGSDDSLTIAGWLDGGAFRVSFADGTTWEQGELENRVTVLGTSGNDFLWGNESGDLIKALDGEDVVDGCGGNDTILGGAGDDELLGGAGDDVLEGGSGDDYLQGGAGDDVYVFNRGDGWDEIDQYNAASGDLDVIRFGAGIAPEDLQIDHDGNWISLWLEGGDVDEGVDVIRDTEQDVIPKLQFADGSVWEISAVEAMGRHVVGTEDSDNLYGGFGDDMIDGLGGNDDICGEAGNDVLTGGSGDDWLDGGAGDDTYVFNHGDGWDSIYQADAASGDQDVIRFGAGITPDDIRVDQDGSWIGLSLDGGDGDEGLDIDFETEGGYIPAIPVIPKLQFADGSVWDISVLATRVLEIAGTDAADELAGTDGADTLIGGAGNDTLAGGLGDDTYVFNPGDGIDRIVDTGGTDTLAFGAGIDPGAVTLGLGSLLVRTGTSTDAIHIEGFDPDAPLADPVVENFKFADGSVLNLEQLLARGFNISGDGELRGTALTDRITGGADDDVLTGGIGDDTLAGSAGDDTYVLRLGDGNDTVIDVVADAAGNRIAFGEGIARGSLVSEHEADGLRIRYGESDSVLLAGYGIDGNRVVGEVAFADGSTASLDALLDRAPVLLQAPPDQAATGSRIFCYALPAGTFADVDNGDVLTYSATLGDGTPLPAWLKLDAASGVFTGTPGNADAGAISVVVKATDRGGLSASAGFTLTTGRTIAGTAYNDTLTGTLWNDIIVGGTGDDAITGSAGNDVIIGNTGSDNLKGGADDDTFQIAGTDTGYDRFEGDDGFDTILGGDGDDTIRINYYTGASTVERIDGGVGSNVIAGTGYNDTLDFSGTELINIARIDGGAGDDAITGSAGADTIIGGAGSDNLKGGAGDDTFQIAGTDTGYDRFEGDDGFDTILGSDGDDTIRINYYTGASTVERIDGGAGSNVIAGTGYNDTLDFSGTELINIARIDGGAGDDAITGSAGADTIIGGAGSDNLKGGAGDDTFQIAGTDTGYDRFEGDAGFDAILGSDGDDTIRINYYTGASTVELIDGGAGSNAIAGTGYNDTLDFSGTELINIARIDGGAGDDAITGSAGNDVIVGSNGSDNLKGGAGDDTFQIAGTDTGYDRFEGDAGFDTILGGDGDDTIRINYYTGASTVERIDGGAGSNAIAGTGYNDTLDFSGTALINIARIDGGAGDDAITGSAGNDVIVGSNGSDNLKGGAGDDTFQIAGTDTGYDRFEGDAGFDAILGGDGDDTIRINYYTGASTVELIDGGAGSNAIAGTGYNDTLDFSGTELRNIARIDGGAGDDAVTGGAGSDYMTGGLGSDRLAGAGGSDILQGGDGNDVVGDIAGNNLLDGGSGSDTLTDDGGSSLLVGCAGNDVINAGDGHDVIVFNKGDGNDTVTVGANARETVSLGGGIAYGDLKLKKSGNDLVLDTGNGEGMTFKNWYAATPNRNVVDLQIVAEAMAGFDAAASDPLLSKKMQDFDFKGLADAFDAVRAATPTLTSWALTNALTQFHLSGSDTDALGGDIAYQYGRNGNLTGIGVTAAQQVIGDAAFGSQTQTLRPLAGLQEGAVRLS